MHPVSEPPLLPAAADGRDAPPPRPRFGPTARGDRLVNIDFARGVALLGILVVNTTLFFGPLASLIQPLSVPGMSGADRAVALLVLVLVQGKFVSLFSLLFGYGLLRQIENARDSGRSGVVFTVRRLGVLAGFGLLHALVLWHGDILFLYAVIGGWLLLARGASRRALFLSAVCLLVVALVATSGLALLTHLVSAQGGPEEITTPEGWPSALRAMARGGFDPSSPAWAEAELKAFRDGPWQDAQWFRTILWLTFLVISLFSFGWLVLGMMVAGGFLWRAQFFDPSQPARRRRVLVIGLVVGLAFEAAAGLCFWTAPSAESLKSALGQMLQQVALFFLPFGYLAGLAWLADRLPGWLREPVARTGRLSLTVYLLQTVVATTLSYHWGFGLFGSIGPVGQVVLAVAIWLLLVSFSHAWLARFRYGPLEALWRRLAYGRPEG